MRNKILKTITYISSTGWLATGAMVDSVSNVPFISWLMFSAWLVLFTYANRERLERFMYGC